MGYGKQRYGRDIDCDGAGDLEMGYFTGTYAALNENWLDEFVGICGGIAIDWEDNQKLSTGVSRDINPGGNQLDCGGAKTVLTDWDDWAHVTLQVLPGGANSGEDTQPAVIACDSVEGPAP